MIVIILNCDWCGKEIKRYTKHNHNFCSRSCLANFSSKSKNPSGYAELKDYQNMSAHMSRLNKELNPTRMDEPTREKLRLSRLNSGEGKTYSKLYGQHEHRVVAEDLLGRKLLPGEIVHHRDGNKRNNSPDNLVVFSSQAEHAKHHAEINWFIKELVKMKEVMPNEVHTT